MFVLIISIIVQTLHGNSRPVSRLFLFDIISPMRKNILIETREACYNRMFLC
jgi:hypothetical protein